MFSLFRRMAAKNRERREFFMLSSSCSKYIMVYSATPTDEAKHKKLLRALYKCQISYPSFIGKIS